MSSTMRAISALALAAAVAACGSTETVYQPACPNMPAYSAENQKATAAELRDAAAKGAYPHLREKVVDGGNTRSQLRGAGCKESGAPRPAIGGAIPGAPAPSPAAPKPPQGTGDGPVEKAGKPRSS